MALRDHLKKDLTENQRYQRCHHHTQVKSNIILAKGQFNECFIYKATEVIALSHTLNIQNP